MLLPRFTGFSTDGGTSIQKGLRLQQIPAIPDISHKIANLLKKKYQKDETYLEICKKLGSTSQQIKQTSLAGLMPPKKRIKSRFMNLDPFCRWSADIIELLGELENRPILQLSQLERELLVKMSWILDYQGFFEELKEILSIIIQLFTEAKAEGISEDLSKNWGEIEINEVHEKKQIVVEETKEYLKEVRTLLPEQNPEDNILCCSDVIESTFGRFKNQMGQYYRNGITSLALTIPAFTCKLTEDVIYEIMNNTTQKDVSKWEEQNISTTLLKTRRQLMPKKRVRKKTKKVA